MSRTIRRCARALAAALAACGILVIAAPAASADPKIPFSQDVYARTHLAKSGMDITVPPGQFEGTVDLATGEQTGTLTLPAAAVTINLFGVFPTADASFVMEPAGPITGHVDLTTRSRSTPPRRSTSSSPASRPTAPTSTSSVTAARPSSRSRCACRAS